MADADYDEHAELLELIGEEADAGLPVDAPDSAQRPKKSRRGRPRAADAEQRAKKRKLGTMASSVTRKSLPTTREQCLLRTCLSEELGNIRQMLDFVCSRLKPYLREHAPPEPVPEPKAAAALSPS